MESLNMNVELPVTVEVLFKAWLDSEEHGLFTGSTTDIDPTVGGEFTAWDGYISGKTLVIDAPRRILQSWRTTEFDKVDPDSKLELLFEKIPGGTRLTLNHTNIPDGQKAMYTEGWEDYYFSPMKDYFCK
jgi:activator of HSP90 ATPase